MDRDALPNLAVLYDASVHRNGTNPLLLYRLLRDYPPERLRVIHSENPPTDPGVCLPGVGYHALRVRLPRFVHNRFTRPLWPLSLARRAAAAADRALELLGGFRPEALVTVANGFLWFTADALGRRTGVPVHLFLHEDWPYLVARHLGRPWRAAVRRAAGRRARPVIRRAASRFSVSPGMAEAVERSCGVPSEVIYPSRGQDSPAPRLRVRPGGAGPPVVAHCGWVHLGGNATLLRQAAAAAAEAGGRLDLYTLHTDADLAAKGLGPPRVRRVGFFPAAEMGDRLGATAHALLVTASFDAADRDHESTLFPSKMADYTAVGLPIVVWGPTYSSVARWAADHPGATVLVTEPDPRPVAAAFRRLAADPAAADAVAAAGIRAGLRTFSFEVAHGQFLQAVARRPTSPVA